jgi:hypothetical protein
VRPRTRNVTLAILGVVVVLLALGALPGLLKSGDPYYVTATVTDGPVEAAVNATALPAARFPYTTAAMENATAETPGRSDPYWEGPTGIKGAFTHSPFDELQALEERTAAATIEGREGVYARANGTLYAIEITRP